VVEHSGQECNIYICAFQKFLEEPKKLVVTGLLQWNLESSEWFCQ